MARYFSMIRPAWMPAYAGMTNCDTASRGVGWGRKIAVRVRFCGDFFCNYGVNIHGRGDPRGTHDWDSSKGERFTGATGTFLAPE
jgi:hypothetical protein